MQLISRLLSLRRSIISMPAMLSNPDDAVRSGGMCAGIKQQHPQELGRKTLTGWYEVPLRPRSLRLEGSCSTPPWQWRTLVLPIRRRRAGHRRRQAP